MDGAEFTPLSLASKEEILEKIEEEDYSFFEEGRYFYGDTTEPGYYTPEYQAYRKRLHPEDGSEPQYTPAELAEKLVRDSVEEVENRNEGDGHAMYLTLHFKPYDMYVTLAGYYSSWGSSEWDEIFVSKPYEVTETYYARVEEVDAMETEKETE